MHKEKSLIMNEEKLNTEKADKKTAFSVKKRIKNDVLLVLVIVILAASALFLMLALRSEGGTVTVTVGGKSYATLSLDTDAELVILGGGGENVLVIENGEAYIREANCPDKICVKHRKIRYSGETIVCLPNGVTVKIEKSGGGPDAVS